MYTNETLFAAFYLGVGFIAQNTKSMDLLVEAMIGDQALPEELVDAINSEARKFKDGPIQEHLKLRKAQRLLSDIGFF